MFAIYLRIPAAIDIWTSLPEPGSELPQDDCERRQQSTLRFPLSDVRYGLRAKYFRPRARQRETRTECGSKPEGDQLLYSTVPKGNAAYAVLDRLEKGI
jgi:hypothetical protein